MTDKRAGIVMALVLGLLLVLWLLPDDSTGPEEAPGGPATAAGPATAPGPKPPAARDKAHRHEATLRSFQGLAAAIPGEAMVLRCKLSASLDPERDLFSPGSETCSTRHVVPFAYEDGWFTTVAASPSGSGGLCQDFQPDDGILKPREVSDRGVMSSFLKASSGLIWEGAGTHSAT